MRPTRTALGRTAPSISFRTGPAIPQVLLDRVTDLVRDQRGIRQVVDLEPGQADQGDGDQPDASANSGSRMLPSGSGSTT